jgi:hypothetical protein
MARSYHIDIAAFAADADRKWVDNLLSHFHVVGVEGGRQGVSRGVSAGAVYQVVLVRRLTRGMGLSADTAVRFANQLLATDGSSLPIDDSIMLTLDRQRFEADVAERIADAVEAIVPARRGRPPSRP